MTARLSINHFAEAEGLLKALNEAAKRGAALSPREAGLVLAKAQVHATLAGFPDQTVLTQEQVKEWRSEAAEFRAERDAFRKVIVGHVYEALMSPSRETRKFAAALATELDNAGVNIDREIEDRAESNGYGPHLYTVDGTVYSLLVQVIDDEGIAWEHTGDWTSAGEPLMGPANGWADRPAVHLPALVRTRGPLRPRKPDPELPPF
jgi:hypothetical protein